MNVILENYFWERFLKMSDELFNFKANRRKLITDLLRIIKEIHPNLTFEIGPKVGDRREFIISASGAREAFLAVISLVKTAPKLRKWKFVAFKPRRETKATIYFAGITVSTEDVLFEYTKEGKGKIGIVLYGKNIGEFDIRVQYAMFGLLDILLGEYDVETRIGTVDVRPLPTYHINGLKPLSELPSIVDRCFKRRID